MNQNSMGSGRGRGYSTNLRTGPLMTDHLKVKNLDRELEILRLKREVVQREQQMFNIDCDLDRKRQYEQTNRNVSNMYGNVWQPPPPKRANAPQQANPWMSTARNTQGPNMSKTMPINYIPSLLSKKIDPPSIIPVTMKPIVHPILKNTVGQRLNKPMTARKDFRITQAITKKRNGPPNKLNSYPINTRKDLLSKATESQLKVSKPPEDPEAMTLRENQIPNNQVTGRLELALGTIVKEIRCSNAHNETFITFITNPIYRRIMKQAVRERIRTIMLNKSVGSVVDIVNQYRERYPKQNDNEIVELVINSQHSKVIVETDDPEEFYKKNITFILEKKIQEMSSNLLKMYGKVRPNTNAKASNHTNMKGAKAVEKESMLNNEPAMKVLRSLTGKYVTTEERNILIGYYTELIEDIVKQKLAEYLPQYTEHFLKIFDLDEQFKTIQSMAIKRVVDEMKEKEVQVLEAPNETSNNKDTLEKDNSDNTIEDTLASENNEIVDETLTKNNEMEEEMVIAHNEIQGEAVFANSENLDKTLTNTNDTQEKKFTDNQQTQDGTLVENTHIEKIIVEADKTKDISLVSPVPMETEESSSIQKSATPMSIRTQESSETIKQTNPVTNKTESPYYVKLICRPTMPNRAVICDFLNNYRPDSIKKHKSINNLLVLSFVNQENYNRILAANETVLGDITVIIKASEKVNPGKENESNKDESDAKKGTGTEIDDSNIVQKETTEQVVKEENRICKETTSTSNAQNQDQDKDFIGKELNDQISDLLSTIQEAEEDNKDNPPSLEAQQGDVEVKNGETHKSDKPNKSSKSTVQESGRSTPVRSSSRLGNVTPSTIRTRRASRLMQE